MSDAVPPRPARRSPTVRLRLIVIALLPMLVVLPLLLGGGVARWWQKFDNLLIVKVNGDLTIARQYLSRLLENSGERVEALAASAAFERHLDSRDLGEMTGFLDDSRARLRLDFLYLLDEADGFLAGAAAGTGTSQPETWPVIAQARATGVATAIDLFSREELAAIDPGLAQRARIDLVPTEAAVPSERTVEARGMVIHVAAAADLGQGRRGVLVGGILLNRNLAFIDTINDLVYRTASLPEGSEGTATLFLEDVRISTNVRLFENVRALGTRVSAVVRHQVLDEGRIWLDRAFVVNDWYISAYEPIVDSRGARIGMLYVGFLETPFRIAKYQTVVALAFAFLLATAIIVPVFLRWVGNIFRPLERMTQTINRVEEGDLGARSGQTGEDEIGRVARHLDQLLDLVEERDRQLRDWAQELNDRVEARTRELREANLRLEETTQQLVMSEKLAAIGEITAGVAHEINNPIAVIQGNLDVARDVIGPAGNAARTEFRLIDEQIHRINLLVTKLLQFARPEEYADSAGRLAPAEVITDCLLLVQHLRNKVEIAVERDDRTGRLVEMN